MMDKEKLKPEPRGESRPLSEVAALLVLGAGSFALDHLTKAWVRDALPHGRPVAVLDDVFRLTHTENSGVAFGLLSGTGPLPALIGGVATLGLVLFVLRAGWSVPQALPPLGLILGGALGNLTDRLADGRVTDFLDVGFGPWRWATSNLADVAIVLGVALLAWAVWHAEEVEPTEGARSEGEPDAA